MSIFGRWRKNKSAPEHVPYSIRDTLFGDMPLDQFPNGNDYDAFPWSAFVSARLQLQAGNQADAVKTWRHILEQPSLESRHYLQAWHFLRQQGEKPPPEVAKEVLGVVFEVAVPNGLDLLAAYADYSARYYNYSGAAVIWEHPDRSLNSLIDGLLAASRQVVAQIGPWEQERPTAPTGNHARMSFLTPSGLHFGHGPMAALSRSPIGGKVLELSCLLLKSLVSKAK